MADGAKEQAWTASPFPPRRNLGASPEVESWGRSADGQDVLLFTLTSQTGARAKICNYGATLVSIFAKDSNGDFKDVVLGFNNVASYEAHDAYFGCTVGRYANRIAGAKFKLDGVEYKLPVNNGPNCLHGGIGFSKKVWVKEHQAENVLTLSLHSKDLEDGFPGDMHVFVTFALLDGAAGDAVLAISYRAKAARTTVVNLTNHAYFNLHGHGEQEAGMPDALNHVLYIAADSFTPTDEQFIPTGEIRSVASTPMDFRSATRIGDRVDDSYDQLKNAGGYDHNFVLRPTADALEPSADLAAASGLRSLGVVWDPSGHASKVRDPDAVLSEATSGRQLEVFTTEPGVQLYCGNFMGSGSPSDPPGKCGQYPRRGGICLETQHFPDTVNKPTAGWPTTTLQAGEVYQSQTVFWFSVDRSSSSRFRGCCF